MCDFAFLSKLRLKDFFTDYFLKGLLPKKIFQYVVLDEFCDFLKKRIYIYFRTSKTRLKLHIEKATDAVLAFFGLSQLRFHTGLRVAAMVVKPWPFGRRFGWH